MSALRLAALVAGLAVFTVTTAVAQEDVMKISHVDIFGSLSRAAVRFPHAAHMSVAKEGCLSCHHDMKDGENVLDLSTLVPGSPAASCASCHAAPRELIKSFHLLCIGCHDTAKTELRVTGPRTCGECHAWVNR